MFSTDRHRDIALPGCAALDLIRRDGVFGVFTMLCAFHKRAFRHHQFLKLGKDMRNMVVE